MDKRRLCCRWRCHVAMARGCGEWLWLWPGAVARGSGYGAAGHRSQAHSLCDRSWRRHQNPTASTGVDIRPNSIRHNPLPDTSRVGNHLRQFTVGSWGASDLWSEFRVGDCVRNAVSSSRCCRNESNLQDRAAESLWYCVSWVGLVRSQGVKRLCWRGGRNREERRFGSALTRADLEDCVAAGWRELKEQEGKDVVGFMGISPEQGVHVRLATWIFEFKANWKNLD